ncbi:MAG: alpha/beta fold hydrolase [Cytophagales bacterium]|jgi:predicted alpha/beta-fold hydrolase|nr:alpha/beta fold hydrolase [Cytophagales bacterium]MCA6388415.1 alpha/beta fold hydrolase [Cytophagales bacterium]MCA6392532.1 alpha/beta fold hydrolase [Cytophagales bacterium]MCA6395729.1 alpha/beta fold hydrolase [Cytophagales bacterium]MCA6400116.1 alpha/beta fold hydrolase [Cytophagales bacterium]
MENYVRPLLLPNRHLETIYPSFFRKVELQSYQRERIETPDKDFLDLDFLRQGASHLVILSHGLEGNTERSYIKGMAKAFFAKGFDVLAWNYRGCSEEMNWQPRFYHSGATEDLKTVIEKVYPTYQSISLVGFSLGGNLTLKFLGEIGTSYKKLTTAVVFSVPLDLHTSCMEIMKPSNWIYHQRFLKSLKTKVLQKSTQQPAIRVDHLHRVKTLMEFDDHFTAPIHGFADAIDYYLCSSSIHFLKAIKTNTLIVNAKNDPFLSRECFPDLKDHTFVRTEYPLHGGHVGFAHFDENGLYWSEMRALDFIYKT